MTLSHSPSIVRHGLVLYYDMNNKKSFKGMPTTNVLPYPEADWTGSAFDRTYWHDATSTHTMTYVTGVDNPIGAAGVMRYTTGTTGYKYWALRGTVPSAGTYTFSYYARMSNGSSSNLNNQQLWRNVGVADQAVSGDWNPTITNEWKRFVTTGTVTTALDYFPIHSGSLTGGYTIDYCGFQLEAGSIASPWVNGTRSNTQSLLDMTNSNTIITNSLTYASDNTFTFNGSSNFITVNASSLNFANGQTIILILKPLEGDANRRNPYDQAYAGYGTITHEPSGQFNYYHGTGGANNTPYQGSTSSMTVAQNEIAMIAVTRGASYVKWYKNGIFSNQVANSYHPATNTINSITIGSGYAGFYYGDIYLTMLYTRELSELEIKQNFNALQRRYGL